MKKNSEIRKEIFELTDIPIEVSWNEEKGWSQYKRKYHLFRRRTLYLGVAAATGLIIIAISFFVLNFSNKNSTIELSTNDCQKKELLLPDGSRVWTNHNTTVKVDLRKKDIEIVGEAYLELANKNDYQVTFPQGKLRTRGSKFNVKALRNSEDALITDREGNVEMIWESDTIMTSIVEPEEQAKIIPQVALVKMQNQDNNYLAWKTDELYFENRPLYYVVEKLEDLYGVEITLSENNLRYCTITSDFKSATLNSIMNELQKQLDSKIENLGKKYLIVGNGC